MSITIIFLVITIAASAAVMNRPDLQYKFMMNPVAVRQGQWYRLITSGFIHGSWTHLGFNMFTFFFFGRNVEYIFGSIKGAQGSIYFIVFYLMGILFSDLLSLIKHANNPRYNSLGASGGVAAIVFSSILFFPTEDICFYFVFCLPGFLLGTMYLIYSYMKSDTMSDNVNHDAHLVGAIFGLIFSVIIYPNVLMEFIQQIAAYRPFG